MKVKTSLKALATIVTGLASAGLVILGGPVASALSLTDVFSGPYRGEGQPASLFEGSSAVIPRVINLMLFIVGVLAVFMMIYGGIAIVGLIVAILGYAIVGWVVSVVGAGATPTDGVSTSEVGLIVSTILNS